MALSEKQQILEIINASNSILIVPNKNWDGDILSACIALLHFFSKVGQDKKKIDIHIDNFSIPEKFSFLPGISRVNSKLENFKNFVISVDVSKVKINEISYDIKGDKLDFIISPKEGNLETADITCGGGDFMYDLIVAVGSPDLESLGAVYDNDPEFFYKVPVVNIDMSPNNEKFGQFNIINLTAAAISEIIFDLIGQIDVKLIDEDIATCLLAGLISKTKSFKHKKVTPKALNTASHLMTYNARKEEIVSNLFRTKTIPVLKLWGKALSRLKIDEHNNIAWSLITKQDFANTNTDKEHISELIEEFIVAIPEAKVISVLYENEENKVSGLLKVENCHDARELAKIFSPFGSRELVGFEVKGKNLLEAEKEVIEKIREKIK